MRFVKSQNRPASSTRRPRDYFSRPEQYRLMVLVFAFMLVVVLAIEAGKPKHWAWLFATAGAGREPQEDGHQPFEEEIDTRIASGDTPPLPRGVFVARREPDETGKRDPDLLPGLDPQLLRAVRDDTVFRRDESAAWFDILGVLAAATDDQVQASSQIEAGFTQLYRQPDVFRGKVVTVRGTVRRAHRIATARNSHRSEPLWRCWLFPDGSTNPVVVYALEMPAGFPTGLSVHEPAVVHGVFFKRWAYAAKGGIMTAPLLLARTAEWTPPPLTKAAGFPSIMAAAAAVSLTLTVAAGVAWWAYRQSLWKAFSKQPNSNGSPRDHLKQLAGQEVATVGARLEQVLRDAAAGHEARRDADAEPSP